VDNRQKADATYHQRSGAEDQQAFARDYSPFFQKHPDCERQQHGASSYATTYCQPKTYPGNEWAVDQHKIGATECKGYRKHTIHGVRAVNVHNGGQRERRSQKQILPDTEPPQYKCKEQEGDTTEDRCDAIGDKGAHLGWSDGRKVFIYWEPW
jgi:hypothetical protein